MTLSVHLGPHYNEPIVSVSTVSGQASQQPTSPSIISFLPHRRPDGRLQLQLRVNANAIKEQLASCSSQSIQTECCRDRYLKYRDVLGIHSRYPGEREWLTFLIMSLCASTSAAQHCTHQRGQRRGKLPPNEINNACSGRLLHHLTSLAWLLYRRTAVSGKIPRGAVPCLVESTDRQATPGTWFVRS